MCPLLIDTVFKSYAWTFVSLCAFNLSNLYQPIMCSISSVMSNDSVSFLQTFSRHIVMVQAQCFSAGKRGWFLYFYFFKSEGLYVSVSQDTGKRYEFWIDTQVWFCRGQTDCAAQQCRWNWCLSESHVKTVGFPLSQDMQVHTC